MENIASIIADPEMHHAEISFEYSTGSIGTLTFSAEPDSYSLGAQKLVNLSVYPVIIFSILGLFLFYPSWGTTAEISFEYSTGSIGTLAFS